MKRAIALLLASLAVAATAQDAAAPMAKLDEPLFSDLHVEEYKQVPNELRGPWRSVRRKFLT